MNVAQVERANLASWNRYLFGAAAAVVAIGLVTTESAEELIGYLAITSLAFTPTALWLWAGAPGIPVWPASAMLYYLYYAVPLLRGNLSGFRRFVHSGAEILNASLTVALFLFCATLTWWVIVSGRRRGKSLQGFEVVSGKAIPLIVFCGLGLGVAYNVALYSELGAAVGEYLGLVRSIAGTATIIGCFLFGHARATGEIRGAKAVVAAGMLATIVALNLSTLFLVLAMMFVLTTIAGYAITAKRLPWVTLLGVLAVAFVLHAGKADMRKKYWGSEAGARFSLTSVPDRMVEWSMAGLSASLTDDRTASVVDRAALVHLLLHVQRLAPETVPYLGGESYALLPYMLMPRFIEVGKITSQAAMRLLNIRFGIQTEQSVNTTSIGWGMIAEGYANFGNLGVAVVGIIIGMFSGFLTRLSDGQPATSIFTFFAAAGMVMMFNLESDLSYFIVNISQTFVALTIFYVAMSMLMGKSRRRRDRVRRARPGLHPAGT